MPVLVKPKAAAPAPTGPTGYGLRNLLGDNSIVNKVGQGLGTVSRIAGSVLSAEGGWPGAGISGGAEALAEFLESSLDKEHSTKRIGAEAVLGLVPFGKIAGGARRGYAVAKTALASGGGDVGRQWAEGNFDKGGEGWNKSRTALNTLLGGASGAIYNKLNPGMPPGATAPEVVIESSGAVPREVAPSGLALGKTPKSDASTGQIDFTHIDKAPLKSGESISRNAGGVSKIEGLPATRSNPVPTTSPSMSPGRVAYQPQPSNVDPALMDNLEKQFGNAMTANDNRFNSFQKLTDNFSSTLEKEMASKFDSLPNRNAENAVAGEKMLGDATQASDKLDKSWQADDQALSDDFVKALGSKYDKLAVNDAAETNLSNQFDDALIKKYQKLDKADRARALIQERRKAAGVEPKTSFSSTVSSETPSGVRESMTTKFSPKEVEEGADSEGFQALTHLLSGKTQAPPQVVEKATIAAKNASPKVQSFLLNLDENGLDAFNYYTQKEAMGDIQAYRKAYQEQGTRLARQRGAQAVIPRENPVEALQKTLTPETPKVAPPPVDPEQLQQSTHPSFYDNGVDNLANAADEAQLRQTTHPSYFDDSVDNLPIAPGKSTIPPAASEKLNQHLSLADPDTANQLRDASAIYNDPNATKEAKKAAGKALAKLARGLQGNKGAANLEVLLGMTGAMTGYAADASSGDDPAWDGALEGLAAGAGAPHIPTALTKLKAQIDPTNLKQVSDAAEAFVKKLPQIERFSLLMNPQGIEPEKFMQSGNPTHLWPALASNAVSGPYGAVLLHAVKLVLMDDPRGMPLLKDAINPVAFGKGMWNSSDEAWQKLVRGEEGRATNMSRIDPNSVRDRVLSYPGQLMTMGDTYAQKLLEKHGISPAEARRATLTSEPGENWRSMANWGKNNVLMQMMFPFRRTPVNILEQGLQTLPLGRVTHSGSTAEMVADQAMGTIAGVGNYAMAANIDDDTTRRNARRISSNAGARLSLPSMLGFILGDAKAKHLKGAKSIITDQAAKQVLPLPSTDVPVDIARKLWNIVGGDAGNPWQHPGNYAPEALKMKPLRQWLGDRMPSARESLGVTPPPGSGVRIRPKRQERK